jgi:1-deoxy-D-xylulose-5-phosphate synthase
MSEATARLLDGIRGPADVKALPASDLPRLAQEIRDEIIAVTATQGGHVGPNLGVVELSIALHRVFDTPADSLVFDVAHQGYVHKLLTGRGGDFFRKLRHSEGASGFLYGPRASTTPSAPATPAPPSAQRSAWRRRGT